MLEDRIIALEEKYSHQDELVYQLNKIVAKQELIIESLVHEVENLREMANSANQGGQRSLQDDVPPHY
jgi:SlyX protein